MAKLLRDMARCLLVGLALISAAECGGSKIVAPKSLPTAGVAARIAVSPEVDTLVAIGDTIAFTATVFDTDGAVLSGQPVSWFTSNETIATITQAGRAVAVANGLATVSASTGGVTGSADLVVSQVASAVRISPGTDTVATTVPLLSVGPSIRFSAQAVDRNGHPIANSILSWTSSDTTIAAVNDSGRAVVGDPGTVIVEAHADSSAVGSATIVVTPPPPRQLLFTNGYGGLFLTDSTMSTERQVAGYYNLPGDVSISDMAWSPDGSRIAIAYTNAPSISGLVFIQPGDTTVLAVIAPDGSGYTQLLRLPDSTQFAPSCTPLVYSEEFISGVSWSPTSDQIIFALDYLTSCQAATAEVPWYDVRGIYSISASGGPASAILQLPLDSALSNQSFSGDPFTTQTEPFSMGHVAWSAGGDYIVFSAIYTPAGDADIYRVRPDGSGLEALTSNFVADEDPSYSPDGSLIYFVSDRDASAFSHYLRPYVMNADGSAVSRIQIDKKCSLPSCPEAAFSYHDPQVSPDGGILAVEGTNILSPTLDWPEIYFMNPDGTGFSWGVPYAAIFRWRPMR